MADPLSVAARLVGLLMAAVNVSTIRLKAEVADVHNILGQLQFFVLSEARFQVANLTADGQSSSRNLVLLRADTFSDLQVFAESLYTVRAKNEHPRESTLDFKRGRTESSAEQTLNAQELAVLKLILNILTCLLQIEAESKFDRLQLYLSRFKTQEILGKKPTLAERLVVYATLQRDT
ncbi:uncharacterized protein PV07_08921 [Cladophialophora immunda]|uniref:Uncharacterized protein n=1 Tax=Cladophialophora immunda TaxID=569365 RepID=A0A0D2AL70_9EURO|nr:uncharacterized protein PV07_08921 [Cladophialophora immunda]KIW25767.1 hypothetical protein PV07_08921 [Cladophialophora immunda]